MHRLARLGHPLVALIAICSALFLLFIAANTRAAAAIYYVASDGNCGGALPCFITIQSAIDAANEGDIIKIAGGSYTTGGFNIAYITKSLVIEGGYTPNNWQSSNPDQFPTILDSHNVQRRRGVRIEVSSPLTVSLSGLTIQNGRPEDIGSIQIITGNVALTSVRIISNTNGGIWTAGHALLLVDSELSRNSGCALRTDNADTTIRATTFVSNSGGAIFISSANLYLYESGFFANAQASSCGSASAVGLRNGNAIIVSSQFVENRGTAVNLSEGTFNLHSNVISGTTMGITGAGLHITKAKVQIIGNQFIRNKADRNPFISGVPIGSGIALQTVTGVISENLFEGNTSIEKSRASQKSLYEGMWVTIATFSGKLKASQR